MIVLSVHLIKSVRNNLLNSKRFVFPPFDFEEFEDNIHVAGGKISCCIVGHGQCGSILGKCTF